MQSQIASVSRSRGNYSRKEKKEEEEEEKEKEEEEEKEVDDDEFPRTEGRIDHRFSPSSSRFWIVGFEEAKEDYDDDDDITWT